MVHNGLIPSVTAFFDKATSSVSYVVADPETRCCVIIDPVLDYDPRNGRTHTASANAIADFVRARGLAVEWILDTHVHADHMTALAVLKKRLGAPTGIGEHVATVQETFARIYDLEPSFGADGSQFDRLFGDGDSFRIGRLSARVYHVPGHTPACLAYVVGDAAFVGDTLLMPDYGTARCDFPGGDAAVLYRSVRRLLDLPANTRVFVAHDYAPGGRDFAWESTVEEQRLGNVHVRDGTSERDFIALRNERDATLDLPALMLAAVQVNIRAGELPPPARNGRSYLQIPLNLF